MHKLRVFSYLLCFILVLGMLGSLGSTGIAYAAPKTTDTPTLVPSNQEQPIQDKLQIICSYPTLEGKSGDSFDFDLELRWTSSDVRVFDLAAKGPTKWQVSILGGYDKKAIGNRVSLQPMKPGETYPTQSITVRLAPMEGVQPDPGEYAVTFDVSSGATSQSIELKAVVTAVYRFAFYTTNGLLNTEATAGEDNHLSLRVSNTGTAELDEISLTSSHPSDWTITYNPEEIKGLQPGMAQDMDVVIKPPRKTVAGDYQVTLEAYSTGLPMKELAIRVTVLTPTIWGWVSVIIVLGVIAGLGVMFRRLGRR